VAPTPDSQPFAQRFLYTGFVTQAGRKMSKSLGNLVPLGDALDRYGATALRWYLLTPRYNSRLEWDERAAARAQVGVEEFARRVHESLGPGQGGTLRVADLSRLITRILRRFEDGFGVDGMFTELRAWSERIGQSPVPRFERGGVREARAGYRRIERLTGLDLTSPAGRG
jgi:cysteinyl-tRNA synthetase